MGNYQDGIAKSIVDGASKAIPTVSPDNVGHPLNADAYELFTRGKALVSQWSECNKIGRQLLLGSIKLEPRSAHAYAWLSQSYHFEWLSEDGTSELRRLASEAAEHAIALDVKHADAHWSLGLACAYEGDLERALDEVRCALEIDPGNADAWIFLGDLMCFAGQAEEGVACVKRGFEANPFPPALYHWHLGYAQYAARRYEEAVVTLQDEVTHHHGSQRILAATLAQLGRIEEARVEAAQFMLAHPKFTIRRWGEKHPFRHRKDQDHFSAGYVKAGLLL